MATATRGKWKAEDLEKAIEEVRNGRLSVREAAIKYSIPKSTIHDHSSSKVKQISARPGPSPILTIQEEKELVNWIIHMAEIGYGQCRQQVTVMVTRILDKYKRPNPFPNNIPGKDWWYAFLRRHPEITLRTPQALEACRAKACTPKAISSWYIDYEQFLLTNDLRDQPQRIWNCDESGFSLCPKSGKVLAASGTKTVYYATSSKGQITVLACVNAVGGSIPPMHIFPGVRFSYNPMEGCVDGSYFGKSENGWITQELFNGWLEKHFVRHIPPERPVCLLLDGHGSHIDLDTSKFCKENGILLYCLPPHSSHITQPLDVGFFSPLKQAWKKEVTRFNSDNPGSPVGKSTFSKVFRKAYLSAIKPETIINGCRHSGIYPPNQLAIDQQKLQSAEVYEPLERKEIKSSYLPTANQMALQSLEEELDEETLKKYQTRLEEGYDLIEDPLYRAWKKLKCKTNTSLRVPLQDLTNVQKPSEPPGLFDRTPQSTEPVLKDILQFPTKDQVRKEKPTVAIRGTAALPKHISSDEVIRILEERKAKKELEEKMKVERKQEREENKKKKEEERKEKAEQRERKREEQRQKKEMEEQMKAERKKTRELKKAMQRKKQSQPATLSQHTDDECICRECGGKYEEDNEINEIWIECESCKLWYHLNCTGVKEDDDFFCCICTGKQQ
uniref:HTH CENPB-type domain-containing protein n=1 Tax=Amphimedon queenslandica TaxID=400682 RepID=A0A1X7UEV0_AMPQE